MEPPRKQFKLPLERIEVELTPLREMKDFVNVSGLCSAGLSEEESDRRRLFMRNASLELLNKLRGDFRGLRIFGAPGVGKSILVWMWACDEFLTNKKKVLWVHLRKMRFSQSVLMSGGEVFKVEDTDADYVLFSDADIIVVDGVTEGESQEYTRNLFYWEGYRKHRKCVQVASTQLRINKVDDKIDKILRFKLPPWTLQEYITACRDREFYNEVSCMFEDLREGAANEDIASLKDEDREDVIAEKFFYAGGSARWMFNFTTKQVMEEIMDESQKVDSFNTLIKGGGGDASKSTVNHLWVEYPVASGGGLKKSFFFVSQYVAREMLRLCGAADMKLLYTMARDLRNPALLGWVIEMGFIKILHDCACPNDDTHPKSPARVWTFAADGTVDEQTWDVPGIVDFEMDTIGSVKESILRHFWLRPSKWNQGGYDLACLLNVDGQYVLRFVQVTAARKHSLKLGYFRDLATKVHDTIPEIELTAIEIVMLVPDKEAASKFRIPHAQVTSAGALNLWFCGNTKEYWKEGKEEEQVGVYWFESRK